MAKPLEPRRKHLSTYVVQDRRNVDERHRLQIQDRMLTAGMGGVLPEQPDPARFTSVLDVGCGTGHWLIELAKAYPQIPRLIGVDASDKMLDFARGQAAAQGVGDRIEFLLMDALRVLKFPNAFFDLVNQTLKLFRNCHLIFICHKIPLRQGFPLAINYFAAKAFSTFTSPRKLPAKTLTKPETGALMVPTNIPRS